MATLDLATIAPKFVLTKTGNKIYPLNIAFEGDKVLVANTKDRHTGKYSQTHITVPKDKICLWYDWPAGQNQYKKGNIGLRHKYLLIPRFLPLDKLTMNALGLLQAEMTRHTPRFCNIIFTNCTPNLINIIIDFFERLGIARVYWSWSIVFNYKLKQIESTEETKRRETAALEFWLKKAKIAEHRKRNKFILYAGNNRTNNMDKDTNRLGTLVMCYSDLLLYQLILALLEKMKSLMMSEEVKHYLQGLFAGEASVALTPTKSIDNVNVGAIRKDEQEFFANCLIALGITSSSDKFAIRIHNRENLIKIYKYGLLSLNKERNEKFLKGFLNFKYNLKNEKLTQEFIRVQNQIRREVNGPLL